MTTPNLPQLTSNRSSSDMGKQHLGEVYAKALLGATEKSGNAHEVLRQLGEFVDRVVDRLPTLQTLFTSPRISAQEKSAMLRRALEGRAAPELLRFLEVVSRRGRLDCLREIYLAARKLWNQRRGVVEVGLATAIPLDSQQRIKVTDMLRKAIGRDVEVQESVDPALIGGIRLRLGDQVIDASVARRLQVLGKEAVANAVRTIRSQSDRFTRESAAGRNAS